MAIAPLLIGLLVISLIINLFVAAALLWASGRMARVDGVTYKKSLATTVLALFTPLVLLVILAFTGVAKPHGLLFYLLFAGTLAGALFGGIKLGLRTTAGKTVLVGLLWCVFQTAFTAIYAFLLALVTMQTAMAAYVIPTGALAETLLGYHKTVHCPQCGHTFTVNASSEADPDAAFQRPIQRCECPNCRNEIDFATERMAPRLETGDRILVAKLGHGQIQRLQIVVFSFPVDPRFNYVERLIGLPGETIAIRGGKIYVYTQPRSLPLPNTYWVQQQHENYSWPDDPEAQTLFEQGKFSVVRKPPELILTHRRLVHDNDCQPADAAQFPQRWTVATGWNGEDTPARRFTHAEASPALSWLRYRHLLRADAKPELITDFLGYNSGEPHAANGSNWAGDLVLECDVRVDRVEGAGELRLELSRGVDRFQARFNLQSGECSLVRVGTDGEKPLTIEGGQEPATRPTPVKRPGTYRVRLANVDHRVTLWVDDELPFGDGVPYEAAKETGPTANDLQPAGVGVRGAAASVEHLKLWRDIYYTGNVLGDVRLPADAWSDPTRWDELRKLPPRFYYVHPGHYFFLGDNSTASADSRYWGLVPERLLQGPAVLVYFPFSRAGRVR